MVVLDIFSIKGCLYIHFKLVFIHENAVILKVVVFKTAFPIRYGVLFQRIAPVYSQQRIRLVAAKPISCTYSIFNIKELLGSGYDSTGYSVDLKV